MTCHARSVLALLCAATLYSAAAHAAEGFQVRYNLAGALGGEMFSAPDRSGWVGGLVYSDARVRKVTGDNGEPLTQALPGGTVPLPAPTPLALYPTYGASMAQADVRGRLQQMNLLLAYVTEDRWGGGRLALGLNLPYAARKTQDTRLSAPTPALNFAPALPGPARAAATAQFNTQFQGALAAAGAADSGEVSGLGDIELQAGWLHTHERLRVLAAASLVLPTGSYDPARGPDVSLGSFYTLRPAVQMTWLPLADLALSARLTAGVSSRNRDTQVRSGNWLGLEAAAGLRTAYGVFGLQTLHVQQIQDDSGNPQGASRLRATHAGAFYTATVPAIGAALTVQYMGALETRNARHGEYLQVRLSRAF
jgi:hypothetical protein